MKSLQFWMPRLLAILLALFFGIFALDVFDIPAPAWKKIAGLIIHLIPSILILIITVYTWKKPLWASVGFTAFFVFTTLYFRTYNHALNFTVISLPQLLIAVLFAIEFFKNKRY